MKKLGRDEGVESLNNARESVREEEKKVVVGVEQVWLGAWGVRGGQAGVCEAEGEVKISWLEAWGCHEKLLLSKHKGAHCNLWAGYWSKHMQWLINSFISAPPFLTFWALLLRISTNFIPITKKTANTHKMHACIFLVTMNLWLY